MNKKLLYSSSKNSFSKYSAGFLLLIGLLFFADSSSAQNPFHADENRENIQSTEPEIYAWSNFVGIRINGHLVEFASSLRLLDTDGTLLKCEDDGSCGRTEKERQEPDFERIGEQQIVETILEDVHFRQIVEALEEGKAGIDIHVRAEDDMEIGGAYFALELPERNYGSADIRFNNSEESGFSFSEVSLDNEAEFARETVNKLQILTYERQLEIGFDEATEIMIRRENGFTDHVESDTTEHLIVYIPVAAGNLSAGQEASKSFSITAGGIINREPVELTLDTSEHGRKFDGFGGNFRLQNPDTDPKVINYNLENMRIAWSRHEMPWQLWHPELDNDPVEQARAGNLNPRVEAAMEMTQKMDSLGIPTMQAVWWAPDWAYEETRTPLYEDKMQEVYESIGDYLVYLKEEYGVETKYFSFNEPDIGIYVLQSPEEHTRFIKEFGAYLESRGLSTKILVGDTGDASDRGIALVEHAMKDPEARQYMGPVSYHSWRGWQEETLSRWTEAAEELDLPLIIGEASIDAAGWRYPEFFNEQVYTMQEINLYTRILAINQPLSILQWQLTADYSVMAGGGIFGDDGPFRPTQRFWNLKQHASTPENVFHMPITSSSDLVTNAAMGNNETGVYAVHLVNNGASREATINGLPEDVEELKIVTTNKCSDMEEGVPVKVEDGQATFTLDTLSYVTLMTPEESN